MTEQVHKASMLSIITAIGVAAVIAGIAGFMVYQDQSQIKTLSDKLSEQTKAIETQQATIQHQTMDIEAGQKTIEAQKSTIQGQSDDIAKKDQHLSELEGSVSMLTAQNQQTVDFMKSYSIALNDIHVADEDIEIARTNNNKLQTYTDPDNTDGYYYSVAKGIADIGKEQATDAKDLLAKAKVKLQSIKDSAPNDFFAQDVSNRLAQIDLLTTYGDLTYNLLDYSDKQLYEINYGSSSAADRYLNLYNDSVESLNGNLKKLSDLQNKIDLQWDQDWYPTSS